MNKTSRRFPLRTALAVVVLAGTTLLLSACAPDAASKPSPSATGGTGTAPATTSASPTPTPTPTAPPTPVGVTCDQVLTPDQLYAFNPNFGTDPGYTPKSGSLEKQIVDWQGVSCGYLNQTSNNVIQIAVAKPPSDQLETLKNAAITSSQPVPTYGTPPAVEGYFKAGSSGQVQIFKGPYWIVAESDIFLEPGDPAPLMESVLGNLPAS